MIKINLLPVREERRKAGARQLAISLVGTLVGTLAIAGFFHWSLMSDLAEVQAQAAETKRQIDQFGPQLAQVEAYRKTKADIEQKLEVIERLFAERAGPVHMLDELATHAPDRLWLTKVESSKKEILIKGMSLDNELVAQFLTVLNASPWFTAVELVSTEAREKEGLKLNAFEISAKAVVPKSPKAPVETAALQATQ
ncbi:MAG: hypothetical protein CL910_00440 [Deltaproteobacteria bacterium]|nr:hypothetical protein [Deltaproteobacteria bacterium]